jgi:hypothetical protein
MGNAAYLYLSVSFIQMLKARGSQPAPHTNSSSISSVGICACAVKHFWADLGCSRRCCTSTAGSSDIANAGMTSCLQEEVHVLLVICSMRDISSQQQQRHLYIWFL